MVEICPLGEEWNVCLEDESYAPPRVQVLRQARVLVSFFGTALDGVVWRSIALRLYNPGYTFD
jgi:hypothetical protein